MNYQTHTQKNLFSNSSNFYNSSRKPQKLEKACFKVNGSYKFQLLLGFINNNM